MSLARYWRRSRYNFSTVSCSLMTAPSSPQKTHWMEMCSSSSPAECSGDWTRKSDVESVSSRYILPFLQAYNAAPDPSIDPSCHMGACRASQCFQLHPWSPITSKIKRSTTEPPYRSWADSFCSLLQRKWLAHLLQLFEGPVQQTSLLSVDKVSASLGIHS